jgi:hypothetical protein
MTAPEGPFDFIWCAGAVYFLGIETALTSWRRAACPRRRHRLFRALPLHRYPVRGRHRLLGGLCAPDRCGRASRRRSKAAGFETLATRAIGDIGWESYYRPMEARIAKLRPGADAALAACWTGRGGNRALARAPRRNRLSLVRGAPGMSLQACAEMVARGDPDRFRAAMAAPLAARQMLFPLYAFNIEVSRAPWVTAEPIIAEMRLQFWRDVIEETRGRQKAPRP